MQLVQAARADGETVGGHDGRQLTAGRRRGATASSRSRRFDRFAPYAVGLDVQAGPVVTDDAVAGPDCAGAGTAIGVAPVIDPDLILDAVVRDDGKAPAGQVLSRSDQRGEPL